MNTTTDSTSLGLSNLGLSSMSVIDWINLTCSVLSVIVNTVALCVFLMSKCVRSNLFYRLVFCITGFNELYAFQFTLHYTLTISTTNKLKYVCSIMSAVAAICFGATSAQLAVVAVDRFQASFPKPTTILQRRRVFLGYFAFVIDVCIVVFYVSIAALYGEPEVADCQDSVKVYGYISYSVTVAEGVWTLCCVILVEIPFCLGTIYRIKQTGIKVKPVNNDGIVSIRIPTISHQQKMKKKMKACTIMCLLVIIHVTTYFSILCLLTVLTYKPEEYKTLYQLSWTVTLVQSILDSVLLLLMIPSRLQCG
ncbi:unnamed protein product [Mytilus edulis]|uniref:G-protein coupled receptors family 1 profile domain-containing protein n=1 Tax=Mytilus edulis TaxID=6550 RepID=A0A8S3UAF5_MYTED|nr:unnamed protein product [Mytilus edulis]